jgi:hypothetical protein
MTTKARIEKTGHGGKDGVRVTIESDGLRFAITSPGKTHASTVLIPKDANAIAQFITLPPLPCSRYSSLRQHLWRMRIRTSMTRSASVHAVWAFA